MYRIESLLSARMFVNPQLVADRLYFISNLSGRLSLYAMRHGGSVPEPLLPPHIAMQNPHLLEGSYSFYVLPGLGKIVVMLDSDGNEQYQPMVIPLDGGYPEPAFPGAFPDTRLTFSKVDPDTNTLYLTAESNLEPVIRSYRANLESGEIVLLSESTWGGWADGVSPDNRRAVLIDGYTVGDHALYLWQQDLPGRRLLYGVPLEERQPGQQVPLNAIHGISFTASGQALLFTHALHSDRYSLGLLPLDDPSQVLPVEVAGLVHQGNGEMEGSQHLHGNRFTLHYNIDGCSWVYEAEFDEAARRMTVLRVLVGQGELSNGTLTSIDYDKAGDRFALSFCTATTPTQIYTIEGAQRERLVCHTAERVLGIPSELLSPGEDAGYTSFDGTAISARLYLPAPALGFSGPRPVVVYVHGGPQGQERPDFAWFSMPLIQFLTLNGMAVFVPNVRGSTGYGLNYTKQVDHDWGGQDRLDHVHALTQVLPNDPRLDTRRAAVVGRSYGGYMTLTLATRHPELWSAAVDMFGPFDLASFMARIPETWKPYFIIAIGDPEKDRPFLDERSPRTYIDQITCPLLVIQGKNDPRVVEQESHDLVDYLRAQGKQVDYLMFENEGHDVLKYENRVACYNAITDFFVKQLQP